MSINDNKDYVRDLLTRKPKLRDDDLRLLAQMWLSDIYSYTNLRIEDMSALDLIKMMKDESPLTKPESVTRIRRKIQEECPSLRGVKHAKRQNHATVIKRDLGY